MKITKLDYLTVEEMKELELDTGADSSDVFLWDGNDNAWVYDETGDYYGITTTERLKEEDEDKATSIEGFGKYFSTRDGYIYIFDFEPSEEALKYNRVIEDDEIKYIEGDIVITEDAFDNREVEDKIGEYDFNTCIWSNILYRVKNINGEDVYIVEYESGYNEIYTELDEAKVALVEDVSDVYIWHFGDDDQRKMRFGDEIEDIITVVAGNNDGKSYKVLYKINLPEDNPAYSFDFIGVTDEDEIIVYDVNNCNVRTNDIPEIAVDSETEEGMCFNDLEDFKANYNYKDKKAVIEELEEYFKSN